MKWRSEYVRWPLMLWLLYMVWRHSHWSVALIITLLLLGLELAVWIVTPKPGQKILNRAFLYVSKQDAESYFRTLDKLDTMMLLNDLIGGRKR